MLLSPKSCTEEEHTQRDELLMEYDNILEEKERIKEEETKKKCRERGSVGAHQEGSDGNFVCKEEKSPKGE